MSNRKTVNLKITALLPKSKGAGSITTHALGFPVTATLNDIADHVTDVVGDTQYCMTNIEIVWEKEVTDGFK